MMQLAFFQLAIVAAFISLLANHQAFEYKSKGRLIAMAVTAFFVPLGVLAAFLCLIGIWYVSR